MSRQVLQHLRDRGIRFTRARRLVIRALQTEQGPRSASDLHVKLGPAVPLSSLYRTLAVLEETGILVRIHGPGGLARYELAEWLTGHHDHLVCLECGATEDIELNRELETTIGRFADRMAGASDFEIAGHSLQLEGVCGACRT